MRDIHKLLISLFLLCSTAAAAQNQDSLREKSSERKILWDEENRMKAVSDNGYTSYYSYDASGERVLKQAGSGEGVHVNSEFSGGNTQTNQYTLYTSPYIVIKNGAQYTKHIYIGTQRIVSKMGDASTYQGADPRRVPKAGDALDPAVRPNWQEKIKLANDDVKTIYDSLKVPYSGSSSAPPFIICPTCSSATAGGNTTTTTPTAGSTVGTKDVERLMFYYHPDHLGSSAYITNLNGEVAQHMEYVPFGEVFLEERNGIYNTPYKFNAKELDEETGLYYYGARYYNPKTSLWLSVDPLAVYNPVIESEFYGDGQHNGGMYNSGNNNPYIYTYQNPIIYVDPNGKQVNVIKKYENQSHNNRTFETNNFRLNPNTQSWSFDYTAHARNKTAKFLGGIIGINTEPQNTIMAGPVLERVKNANSVKKSQVELAKLLGKDGKIENGETQGFYYDIGKIGGKEFWKIAINSTGDFLSGKFFDDNTFFKEENILGSFWATARVSDDGQNITIGIFDTKTTGSLTDGLLKRDKGNKSSKFHLYMWSIPKKDFLIQSYKNSKTK